ncbi:hypothetical protein ABZ614_20410 [Streptomyces sp. NPDC013178]|uniref:hypothetical protein n=1 Tax=Streptomyces sp. NPDC013178 TaxID=3155118 RepID=UPI0033E1895A
MKYGKHAATALVGAAVLTLGAQSQAAAAPWEISGYSTNRCAFAHGDYQYAQVGELGGLPAYNAEWDLYAYDECPGDGYGARLQVSYDEWNGWSWVNPYGWRTIAKSGGSHRGYPLNVRNVHFQICVHKNTDPESIVSRCAPVR